MVIRSDNDYYKNVINRITSALPLFQFIQHTMDYIIFLSTIIELSVIFIVAFLFSLSLILEKLLSIKSKGHFIIPLSFGIYA